nr:MAG TPA: hypothetical protein [Caudoviricetes sp.]
MADLGKRLILPFVCDMIFKSPRIISDPIFLKILCPHTF